MLQGRKGKNDKNYKKFERKEGCVLAIDERGLNEFKVYNQKYK